MRIFDGLVILSLLAGSVAGAASDERLERLPEKYRTWLLEEVNYIITEVEREAFLRLETVEEREAFIEAFWRRRDTNPSTPENEFREEHYRRLEYANKFFGRDTFRPGWQTDRGKYYILLGKPSERQFYDAKDAVYPAELWFYNDPKLKRYGLPPFFYLLFFRRHGVGELELYSPVADGPQELLTGYQWRSMDFRVDVEQAYDKLFEISPELAQAAISFRTDEGDTAQFQAPSFGTLTLMDQIARAPFRGVDTSYAEHFDLEKGTVESDYLFTYVPSWGMMNVLPGPEDTSFLHWTVELDAQHVSFVQDVDAGQYASVFIVTVEIVPRDHPDKILLQQRDESFLTLKASEAQKALHLPFAYSGMMPVVPGAYDVRIILRNRACPGRDRADCAKAYTVLQAPIDVPEDKAATPRLSEVVLAYGAERPSGRPLYRPYRLGPVQLLPNPRRVYAIGETLVAAAQALDAPDGAEVRFRIVDQTAPERVLVEKTVAVEGFRLEPFVEELSLEELAGGRYRLMAELLDPKGAALDTRSSDFTVTPRTRVARPGVRGTFYKTPPEVPGLVAMALAEQYLSLERKDRAREAFEKAVSRNPKLGPARERLAGLLLEQGDAARVVELLKPVVKEVQDRFEVLALLGEAYFRLEDYTSSAELLEKAMVLRPPPTRLLNFLALSHYRLGELSRAKEVLEHSLEVDPDQPSVKELLEKWKVEGGLSRGK